MTGAEYIIKFLREKSVDIIFGYPGGSVLTLYDEIFKAQERGENINHILTRHEQGAIHAAEGYSKLTGKTSVVIATSGPGATNLVTGLADAMLDSVPILAITGQVKDCDVGHDAFQEADMLGVTLSITKHNYLVKNADRLPYVLEEAWQLTRKDRHGPVLIDIPKNIFLQEIKVDCDNIEIKQREKHEIHTLENQKEQIINILDHSFRPVILAGGGVTLSDDANESMRKFMEKFNIPCATTLMGKSVIHTDHHLALGMAGMHGLPAANTALVKSDTVIAVGTRFSDRTIGNPAAFSKFRSIIHADIDIAEISKNIHVTLPVVCDAKEFFDSLLDMPVSESKARDWKKWAEEIIPAKENPGQKMSFAGSLKAREIIRSALYSEYAGNPVIVTDVGQHQMIAAQETKHSSIRSFITSGGLGTMGFGLPAAVGAAFGCDEKPLAGEQETNQDQVILFVGDGGIQMTIQELATVRKPKTPVKIFILDNNRLGMVRQWQKHFYGSRYSSSVMEDNPEFITIAAAYGLKAIKIENREELAKNIDGIMQSRETILVHCLTDPEENVYPIIPAGKNNHEMIISEEAE